MDRGVVRHVLAELRRLLERGSIDGHSLDEELRKRETDDRVRWCERLEPAEPGQRVIGPSFLGVAMRCPKNGHPRVHSYDMLIACRQTGDEAPRPLIPHPGIDKHRDQTVETNGLQGVPPRVTWHVVDCQQTT